MNSAKTSRVSFYRKIKWFSCKCFYKFIDWVLEVIEDIKTALKNAKLSTEEKSKAKKNLAELEHIKDLLANAIKAAENVATELADKKAEGKSYKSTRQQQCHNLDKSRSKWHN